MPLKTVERKQSVTAFVNSLEHETRRKDAKYLIALLKKITGKTPKLWGDNGIIGFGKYTYTRKNSTEELEWFNIGFAPRKTRTTLYLTCYLDDEPLVKKLGKCKYGKGCLHINKLEDVDLVVLKKLLTKYKSHKWHQ